MAIDLIALMMTWDNQHKHEAQHPSSSAVHATKDDTIVTEGGKRKNQSPEVGRPSKVAKREGDSDITLGAGWNKPSDPDQSGPSPPPSEGCVSSAHQDNAVGLLIRILISLHDVHKDDESALQHAGASKLLAEVNDLWPAANYKLVNLDKIVEEKIKSFNQQQAQAQAAQSSFSRTPHPPVLTSALFILKTVLKPCTPKALQSIMGQVVSVVDQCFAFRSQEVVDDACFIVKTLFAPPPPPKAEGGLSAFNAPPANELQGIAVTEGEPGFNDLVNVRLKIEDLVTKHLRIACSDPPPLPPGSSGEPSHSASSTILSANPSLLNSVCLALTLIEEISIYKRPLSSLPSSSSSSLSFSSSSFEDGIAPLVIKCLVKATKELNAQAQMIVQQHARSPSKAPLPVSQAESPQYATLAWVVAACLKLCGLKTLLVSLMHLFLVRTMPYYFI